MDKLDSHQEQPRQLDDEIASLFQGTHSSSSSASSSHSLLLSLSQTIHGLQANPSESVPQLQEEILPLLALPAPHGVSALLPIWKGAFEGKASEPTGYTSNEEVRVNVQVALVSARLLRNVVGGCQPLQNLVFERTAGEILALLRLGSSLAFVSDPERECRAICWASTSLQRHYSRITLNQFLNLLLLASLDDVSPTPTTVTRTALVQPDHPQ